MGERVIGVESPVLDLSGNWSVSFLEAWHCSAGILPKVKRKPSSDGEGELRRPRSEDIKEIPPPLPQGLVRMADCRPSVLQWLGRRTQSQGVGTGWQARRRVIPVG